MNRFLLLLHGSPVRDWALVFLAINYLIVINVGDNAQSRWATLAAMSEDRTFAINNYVGVTSDWARTPAGRYYSNKAPGPMLIGFPVFWCLDRIDTAGMESRADRDARRIKKIPSNLHILSMLTQAIPFALIVVLIVERLRKMGVSTVGLHIAAVAMLFGNTASLFMNTYFGHAMSAMYLLATVLALMHRWPFRTGLFFGLAVLCDYSVLLLALPIVLVFTMNDWWKWRRMIRVFLGGLAPLVLLGTYHQLCFGTPLTVPSKYQNPVYVDVAQNVPGLWGIFHLFPDPKVIQKLLFSPERGIAYTQGWVFACLVLGVALWLRPAPQMTTRNTLRWLLVFAATGLSALLWLNGCWGGWHGGSCSGPRYLSPIMPVFGLTIPLIYGHLSAFWRQALLVSVIPAVGLYVLALGSAFISAGRDPLFEFYFSQLVTVSPGDKLFRISGIVLAFGWALFRAYSGVQAERRGRDMNAAPANN